MKGVLRQLTFRRLALALLPTAVLTAGVMAFGRDDAADRRAGTSSSPATLPASEPEAEDEDVLGVSAQPEEPLEAPARSKRKRPRPDARDAGDDVAADPAPPAPDPTADTGAAVRQAVTDTVATMGFTGARVSVSDGGHVVAVAVRGDQACESEAGERLAGRIRSSLPEVRTVRVSVRGSGQSLSAYRRARCEEDEDEREAARGQVVYAKRGSGTFTTPTFVIAARAWSVTYRNDSDFFQAFVVKGGRIQPFVLNSSRRGTRTETLRGPGRFRLRINGAEGWSVTVRDGA